MQISNSNIKPNCCRVNGDNIFLIDTENIKEKVDENDVIAYEYTEYKLDITMRDNIEEYVNDNFQALLTYIRKQLKKTKFIELEKARESMIYDKFEFEGRQFACDKNAREDIAELKEAYDYSIATETEFTGRYWYTYGGKELIFLTSDKIQEFCIQRSFVKDSAWTKFAMLNNKLKVAITIKEIEAINW